MTKREFLKRLKKARTLVDYPLDVFYVPMSVAGFFEYEFNGHEIDPWLYRDGDCCRSKKEVYALYDNSIAALEAEIAKERK